MTWCDWRSLPSLVVALGLTGCFPSEGLRHAGPTVVKVATIELQETESLFVSQLGEVGITRSGGIVVGDALAQRAIQFNSKGQPVRVFGRKGRGPGEFRMMGEPVPLGDSLVAIPDDALRRLQFFDLKSGEYRRVISDLPGVRGIIARNDAVWLTTIGPEHAATPDDAAVQPASVARINLATGEIRFGGALPVAFTMLAPLGGTHHISPLTLTPEGVLVGVSGLDSLVLHSPTDLTVLRAVRLPAVRRRQVGPDITDLRTAFDGGRPPADSWKRASFLVGLHAMPGGEIVVLHMDQDLVGQGIVSHPFVSLVSSDLTRACVDTPVPLSSDARIAFAFGSDQLVLLTQEGRDQGVRTIAHLFTVSDADCTWIPLR